MFRKNTVLVLGAAASEPFGFPLGSKLKQMIAERLRYTKNDFGQVKFTDKNHDIFRSVCHSSGLNLPQSEALKIFGMLCDGVGLASSIDNFLEMRKAEPEISYCAKIVIASIILELEHKCVELHAPTDYRKQSSSFDGKWHQQFAQICFEGATINDAPEALRRISIISFNYDRTFEQFVRIAICRLYSVPWAEACSLGENLIVTHPYGTLAPLPGSNASKSLEFGMDGITHFLPHAGQIKTFTEQLDEANALNRIAQQTQDADTIVFLVSATIGRI